MQTLDISQINILAPYPVWYEGEEILFKTDYNIFYSVAFELDDMLGLTAYWFRITNRSGKNHLMTKDSTDSYYCYRRIFRKTPTYFFICVIQQMNNKHNVIVCFCDGLMRMNRRKICHQNRSCL